MHPVTIRNNQHLYDLSHKFVELGGYILSCYVGKDGSVNVSVSFLGLAIYNVRLLDKEISTCKHNALFQTVTLDGDGNCFSFEAVSDVKNEFDRYTGTKQLENGQKIAFCNSSDPKIQSDFRYRFAYLCSYESLQRTKDLCSKIDSSAIAIIRDTLDQLFSATYITPQYLRRFINDRYENIRQGIKLLSDPVKGASKEVVTFYILFLCGKNEQQFTTF